MRSRLHGRDVRRRPWAAPHQARVSAQDPRPRRRKRTGSIRTRPCTHHHDARGAPRRGARATAGGAATCRPAQQQQQQHTCQRRPARGERREGGKGRRRIREHGRARVRAHSHVSAIRLLNSPKSPVLACAARWQGARWHADAAWQGTGDAPPRPSPSPPPRRRPSCPGPLERGTGRVAFTCFFFSSSLGAAASPAPLRFTISLPARTTTAAGDVFRLKKELQGIV